MSRPRHLPAYLCLLAALGILAACGGGGGGDSAQREVVTPQGNPPAAPITPSVVTALTLRAAGTVTEGVGARVTVRYNGVERATLELRTTALAEQRVELGTVIDGGKLEFVFSNARDGQGRRVRHAHIDSLQVGATLVRTTDAIATFDRGSGPAAFDETDLHPGQAVLVDDGRLVLQLPTNAALAAATASATGPGFFVDAENGDDSHAGTAAQPWRTLGRARAVRLQSGQGLYLRCGQVWRETLDLGAAQLQDNSVVAGYGPECLLRKAVVSGADSFSGSWQKSGALWSRSLPAGTPRITQLFLDGRPLRTARWPDADDGVDRPALAGAGRASGLRVPLQSGAALSLAGKDLAGAAVHVRTQPWIVETRTVTALGPEGLELDRALAWPLDAGEAYVLENKLWMLDRPGEFFHDVASQRLYLMAPETGAPADLNAAHIEGSVRDVAIALSQRSQLVLRDLAGDAAREDGWRLVDTPQAQLTAVQARHNGLHGVQMQQWQAVGVDTPGPVLRDSRLAGNARYGLYTVNVARATVLRNEVLATGNGEQHRGGVIAAIYSGPGGRAEDNRVDGSGYVGIAFSPEGGGSVARNHITGYCQRLSDCAAIYGWAGVALAQAPQASTVQGNRIGPGTAQLEGAVGNGREVVAGIYLDDHVRGALVRGNVIAGAAVGIFLHNASDSTVEDNKVWLPGLVALWGSMDKTDGDWMRGNRWRNNELVPLVRADAAGATARPVFRTAQAIWMWHALAGEAALAPERNSYGGNTVVHLQGPLAAHALLRGPDGEREVDALEWQRLNAGEPMPSRPVRYDAVMLELGPELLADGGFDNGLGRWQSYTHPDSLGFNLEAVATGPGCTGPCLRFSAGHPGDLVANWPLTLRAGATYLYRWTAGMPGSTSATVGAPYIGRDGSPYDNMADAQGYTGYLPRRATAGDVLAFETFFAAKSADPARLNFQLESLRAPVTLDQVSVREVLRHTAVAPEAWAAMPMAPAAAARVVDCADLGWAAGCQVLDLEGRPVNLPLTLAAGSQRLLLRADTPARR